MTEGDGGYDPVELRRRIVVAFSAGELQRFAEELGVGASLRWDRGVHEAARDLVRQFEKNYGGLDTLVASLRAAKPLVEWPEAAAPPNDPAAANGGAAALSAHEPAPIPHPFGNAPALATPGTLGGPDPPPAPPIAPMAAAPAAPRAVQAAAPAPAASGWAPPPGGFAAPRMGDAPGPAPPAFPAAAQQPQARAPAGVDPRILVVVAGLMVVAAVIAYFAGRATNPSAQATPAPSATETASAPRRADGPATRVRTALERGIENVARACEVRAGAADEVFARSFDHCGPTPPAPRKPAPRSGLSQLPKEPREPERERRPAPAARPGAGDKPPRETGGGCLKGCAAEQAACKGRCGAEPSQASKYDAFQQCQGRCITQASKCRLGCP